MYSCGRGGDVLVIPSDEAARVRDVLPWLAALAVTGCLTVQRHPTTPDVAPPPSAAVQSEGPDTVCVSEYPGFPPAPEGVARFILINLADARLEISILTKRLRESGDPEERGRLRSCISEIRNLLARLSPTGK
jgi:hypothetical protein